MPIETLKKYARQQLWKASPEFYRKRVKSAALQKFAIGILEGDHPFQLQATRANNPVLSSEDVTDIPATFVADPFMIRKDRRWYMFFEALNSIDRQGQIGLATSLDGKAWEYEQIVLCEPFHLAYPFIFEWHDDVYMVPDTPGHGIRLYRAHRFPYEWVFVSELRTDNNYSDSSLFAYGDRWWMFTAWRETRQCPMSLRLFSAYAPVGPWQEHPASPIVQNDAHISRPAGRPTLVDNKLYRFAQDCADVYGKCVHALEISELTPTCYKEHPVSNNPLLEASDAQWNTGGMHHIDLSLRARTGRWLACVDGWHAARE